MPYHFRFLGLLLILLANLSCLLSQDIIFPDKTRPGPRPTPKPKPWGTKATTTTSATTSKLTNCERLCVVLDLCPALSKLLDRPTRQSLTLLKRSSCGFTPAGDPLVWCDDFVCDQVKKRGPQPPSIATAPAAASSSFGEHQDVFFSVRHEYTASPFASTRSALPFPFAAPGPSPAPAPSPGARISDLSSAKRGIFGGSAPGSPKPILSPFKIQAVMTPGPLEPTPKPKPASLPASKDLYSVDCGLAFPSRISGGSNAVKGEFPWLVAISVYGNGKSEAQSKSQVICGGALISGAWVLTAAHCVSDSAHNLRNISHVRVGAHNISNSQEKGAEDVRVKRIVVHGAFRERPVVKNDIALLQLERSLAASTAVGPICLPTAAATCLESFYKPGEMATIAGWGSDGAKASSKSILQKVEVPLVDGEVCRRAFYRVRVRVVPEIQICAGEPGRDSCKGDSGGPLMTEVDGRTTLIGIISYGTTQCDGRLPGVYTKVTSYVQWIHEHVDQHSGS